MATPAISLPSPGVLQAAQAPYLSFLLSQGNASVSLLVLPLKPAQLQLTHPARVMVTQVVGGVYTDDFGFGVPTITLQGHTDRKSVV